jgi:hypothetical protein
MEIALNDGIKREMKFSFAAMKKAEEISGKKVHELLGVGLDLDRFVLWVYVGCKHAAKEAEGWTMEKVQELVDMETFVKQLPLLRSAMYGDVPAPAGKGNAPAESA